jgi:glycosyltransferase involved in cell wall biosynthesis
MHLPFFSIVIPTKNRPSYLKESILSVLLQKFNNYELIVSDNFNDEKTRNVVKEFSNYNKLKYFRTDKELNMIDHWEFATAKAIGKYVIVLTDRKLLYNDVLNKLHQLILKNKENFNCISYIAKCYDDLNGKMLWSNEPEKTKIFPSIDLINNFLSQNYFGMNSYDTFFPKTLNSCYKNSHATEVRKKLGSYFNNKGVTTPDYSSFFINVLSDNEILFAGFPVILSQGEHTSNGRNFGKGNISTYMQSLGNIDPYQFVPIKAPFIYNLLMNDFLTIQKALNLSHYSYDIPNYYVTNYFEYKLYKENEINTYFLQKWEEALSNESDVIIGKVKNGLDALVIKSNEIESKIKLSQFHLHLRDYLKNNYSHVALINKLVKHRFNSALSAAGFKNAEKTIHNL